MGREDSQLDCIYVNIVYGENIRTWLRARAAGNVPIMGELLHVLDAINEPLAPKSQSNSTPNLCAELSANINGFVALVPW